MTRLNGKGFTINALYIETIESFPDTTITLTNGRKYVVREDEHTVKQLINDFYQSINLFAVDRKEDMTDEEK